ncbi:AAA family ATPase [Clostridium botulinum]|uniref:AAA family ATPase n=1 Tax=Clostridium botulinum TaxID=1491 RepID=UPI000585D0FF|nr:AAA family ATPase [Clostridium botulinum]AJD27317.1 AAA domain protein [Clostridium botulinum CDC_297]MBY6877719.1 AAA family ATPase [Clostridium botulinum]MBY6892004.1 AAA family ATPase [Clostridium botulinum]MBY6894438.1 AAA family ATPase [Clostridium botulinum]MBY6901670.1 AAA family ATPase [Clostridium botulinum]
MSKIKKLNIKNFLGLQELGLDCSKINLIKGPKGSGKSSIIESIEKGFTNKNRRTEVVKHGEEEATIYIELDDGLSIDRRLRTEKADYLKVRKEESVVPSTEKFLRSLINGDIFRPLDWVNMNIKEQTKSILSMLEIGWNKENIVNWFDELPSNIDYDQHILQILKAIELKYYKDREEVNRDIRELKTQIKVILDELPAEYDGEVWREKKVQDYYNKVAEVQKINHWIEEVKALQANFEDKVNAIKSNAESEKSRIQLKFKDQRQDIKDIIELSKSKIDKSKNFINNSDRELELKIKELTNENVAQENKVAENYNNELKKLEEEYEKRKEELVNLYSSNVKALENSLNESIEITKKNRASQVDEQKELISINENKIAAKKQELLGLDSLEQQEVIAIDEKINSEIEKEEIRVGKAADYLKNNEVKDIEPLQAKADEVAEMQSYLREWDRMVDIRDNKLAAKERYSNDLTARIDKARELPGELLKTAKMPIEGISVDAEGFIRINNTLIDGLSDGEKLELAMRIAKAQAGELKVICLDKFESLNPKAQKKLLEEMSSDEYQYFVTSTMADEFEIEKIG